MRLAIDIPPGVISDETTFSTQGRWADCDKARPYRGRMQALGGWAKVIATALTGTCRNVLAWIDSTVQQNIAFGTNSALMVLKSGTLADITPVGLGAGNVDFAQLGYGRGAYGRGPYGGGPLAQYYPRTWSLATWGEQLVASPRGRGLYLWTNDTATPAAILSNAPENINCMLVNSLRQVMVFGCNEFISGDYNPMCIRGSDFEDNNFWDPSDDSKNSFEKVLEGGGRIVMAALMGSSVVVWTDTSLFLGSYTGQAIAPWRFDLIANNCGLSGPNALTVINQAAYWLTPDLQFYSYQIGFPPAPLPCPIRNEFKDNLVYAQIDKVASASNSEFGEVWFFYPDGRDGTENSRFIAVSLEGNAWFRGTLERTAAIDSGPQQYPLMISPESYVYYHEYGNDADGQPLEGFIHTSDFYLDDAERRVFIKGLWPDFEDQQGSISLTLYTRSYPQAEPKAKGPYALAVGREKRDFTIDTRLVSLKFAWDSAPAFMRMGKPSFEFGLSGAQ